MNCIHWLWELPERNQSRRLLTEKQPQSYPNWKSCRVKPSLYLREKAGKAEGTSGMSRGRDSFSAEKNLGADV